MIKPMSLVLLLFTTMGLVSLALADENNPCDQLIEITSMAKHQLTPENAYSLLKSIIKPYKLTPQTNETIVFTNQSGFALLATCHSEVRFERSLYYPIGLTGLILGEKVITTNGKPLTYAYILTSYGLRVYIPSKNVTEVKAGTAYIFANSKFPTEYCAGRPKCTFRKGREIHSNLRYAMVTDDQEVNRLMRDESNGICGSFKIEPFSEGHRPTKENYALVSTCLESDDGKREQSGNLEVVWKEKVLAQIKDGVNGSFARLSPKIADEVLSLLSLSNTKECSTEKTEEEVATVGLAANTPKLLITATGEANKKVSYKRKVPGEYFFRFAAFSWNIEEAKDYEIEDVSFVSKCKDLKPRSPLYITLYSKKLPEESVTIDVDDLSNSYIEFLGEAGFNKTQDIDDLRQGRFWQILGSDQYFQWRGVILWKLRNSQQIKDFLFSHPVERKNHILNFLTHIILASSFKYDVEEKPKF